MVVYLWTSLCAGAILCISDTCLCHTSQSIFVTSFVLQPAERGSSLTCKPAGLIGNATLFPLLRSEKVSLEYQLLVNMSTCMYSSCSIGGAHSHARSTCLTTLFPRYQNGAFSRQSVSYGLTPDSQLHWFVPRPMHIGVHAGASRTAFSGGRRLWWLPDRWCPDL